MVPCRLPLISVIKFPPKYPAPFALNMAVDVLEPVT